MLTSVSARSDEQDVLMRRGVAEIFAERLSGPCLERPTTATHRPETDCPAATASLFDTQVSGVSERRTRVHRGAPSYNDKYQSGPWGAR